MTFFANNRYEGWTAEDIADPRRWFDLDNHPEPSLVEKRGPGRGRTRRRRAPRCSSAVSSARRRDAPIEMPAWFRIRAERHITTRAERRYGAI